MRVSRQLMCGAVGAFLKVHYVVILSCKARTSQWETVTQARQACCKHTPIVDRLPDRKTATKGLSGSCRQFNGHRKHAMKNSESA